MEYVGLFGVDLTPFINVKPVFKGVPLFVFVVFFLSFLACKVGRTSSCGREAQEAS